MHCPRVKTKDAVKKKRRIFSFEPDNDVEEMVDKAQHAGLVMAEILNEAMRECGKKVITELAEKQTKALRNLSFNQAEFQLTGLAEAA